MRKICHVNDLRIEWPYEGFPVSTRYALSDSQWEKIKNLLHGRAETVGVTAKDNRLFVNAVVHRYRSGIPWRVLTERFGNWKVVHLRHSRWSKKGVWNKVFDALSADADNEYAAIDSAMVKARQHSAGATGKDEKKNVSGAPRVG